MLWVCPTCRVELDNFLCPACEVCYPVTENGQPDFRPTATRVITHRYRYDPAFGRFPWDQVRLSWPDAGTGLAFTGEIVERQMLRAVPRTSTGAVALDVGCGETRQRFRDGLVALGYAPLGLDIHGPAADALADAHCLPLPDAHVDLVMTSAVFEHLKHPPIAMAEVARVAKPGALFVGSVAFGEPFHISYYHHSPLAVYDLLDASGFDVSVIVLDARWSAIKAHLDMGYVGQRVPRLLHGLLAGLVREWAILPARLRGHAYSGRLAFARSHSGIVGFVATRRAQ